jgi:hypothetical protein
MNTLTSNPNVAQMMARHAICDRLRAAEQRAQARAARAERRTARRGV